MTELLRDHVFEGFDEEQESMREVLRTALERADVPDAKTAVPGTLGITGLLLPEDAGGLGCGPVELLLVSEELGAQLADADFLVTSVIGASLLEGLPGAAAEKLRSRVAGGDVRLAVAELAGTELDTDGRTVFGELDWVLGDAECDVLLAVTPAGLMAIELAQQGVRVRPLTTLDERRSLCSVQCSGAVATVLARPDETAAAVERASVRGELAVTGIAIGGAKWAMEAAVSYARTRVQFGQPIGSFQAVKHLCSEMLVGLESAKALAINAALLLAEPAVRPAARRDLDAAFLCATEEFVSIAKAATHVHGGVGVTWEFGLHFYLKRALTLGSLLEPVRTVRARVRTALRDEGSVMA